jgi:two-component system NtrC family sensor kinase
MIVCAQRICQIILGSCRIMKIGFSISQKLLLFILPLVCLPIAIVGYFSIRASVERVNRLVRHEQMVAVKATANKINDVFYYSRIDLETISSLPVLEDYHTARSFRLDAEAEFNYDNIVRLFKGFIARTSYYYQIRYIGERGHELIKVRGEGAVTERQGQSDQEFFTSTRSLNPKDIYISDITYSSSKKGFLIRCARPVFSGWREFAGVVVIDLDVDKIIEIVKKIHVGEKGYAFLVDQFGRSIAHPIFEPYQYSLENYPDPSLRELVLDMMAGDIGWKSYFYNDEEKVAAFAFIPIMGWSLAVTISSAEFRREALAIRARVILVVVITLIITVAVVSLLSYYLLRPVRNLVMATNRIARGDLKQEIAVQSRDELGDLTRSFNRMMRNLSMIQNELVRSEKLISLGRLSAGVAHEIRNPLNAMKGAIVYLQRRRSQDPLIKEYTHLVSEEIDRLNSFVTEFLYFARQSASKPVATDLNKLILSTQSLFEKEAEKRGIKFYDRLDPALPVMRIDSQQIEQVLVNVLINAMDAMPRGGIVTFSSQIRTNRQNPGLSDLVQVTVEDSGIGITEENLQNIFDPFFSTKDTGTGLGLPLSLGIVENHGGKIRIFGKEGLGTTVIIEWPINAVHLVQESEIEEKEDIIGG